MGSFGESCNLVGESVQDIAKDMAMVRCCGVANMLIMDALKLIHHSLSNRKPINNEEMSFDLYHWGHLTFRMIEKHLESYSHEKLSYCFPPKIEGGDHYNADSRTPYVFGFDVFKFSVGIQLQNLQCYFVRTICLNETKQYKENFNFLDLVHEKVLENLRDGVALCEVYKTVKLWAERENPHLATHLQKDFGFQLDPHVEKNVVSINSDSKVIAKKGMYFVININLIGLKEDTFQYSICHSDTVSVRKNLPATLLTCNKGIELKIGPFS